MKLSFPHLLLAALLPLAGCAELQSNWGRYRHFPAGQDAAIWRPTSVSDADFDAQTAHFDDLNGGRIAASTSARTSTDAVDRMMSGRPTPLPVSSISKIGQSGNAQAGGATGGGVP
jgi:hypothetical protein